MISKLLRRSALHEHTEPEQRILGAEKLPPESEELAHLLAADPSPEVRAAAAQRCGDFSALGAAWESEDDPVVRTALSVALINLLSATQDTARAGALLAAAHCTDAIRAEVARRTQDTERRRMAIEGVRDEDVLIELALSAEHADTRMAAAERVRSLEALRKLADAAKSKDHGVARLARQRIEAMEERADQAVAADAILAQLEALAVKPGPILTEVVELNRRWQALDMSTDAGRLARCDAARQALQARFDREHEEQRSRARFERRLREWMNTLAPPATHQGLGELRSELATLREEAQVHGNNAALAELDGVEQRLLAWDQELRAVAGAEALVLEAEQFAGGTSIDDAKLPDRWQALDPAIRTPALTQRFEAALMVIEQRRLAQVRAAEQETHAARRHLHELLHVAEQALAGGQLQSARVASDQIKKAKAAAGPLPKPTVQRLGRLVQQLVELERWESFGQRNARVQLCERAEAIPAMALDPSRLAQEVQKLRNEWKALDQQHAGVPKALWERFDSACEKSYAPAARHFAQLAAQRKQARKRREEFIEAAAAHVSGLAAEQRDWRAIERWLRETDHAWREGDLGSIEPAAWEGLDKRFKAALAPLRGALSGARDHAKAERQTLIAAASALIPKALERDAPSQVKAIQAKWQEQAKALSLPQRDERALWEQFRAACDAVFNARQTKRKEEDGRKSEQRRALEDICAQLEQLARAADQDEQHIRRSLRVLQEQWKKGGGESDAGRAGIESRFRTAKAAVETALTARARSREAVVWQTLAAKERLCDELDGLVRQSAHAAQPDQVMTQSATVRERWAALPALPAAWEQKMAGRYDAALRALSEAAATGDYLARMDRGVASRRDGLLQLEVVLGLESPEEFQSERLALQVRRLKERFTSAASAAVRTAEEHLLAWCAEPGVADASDRQRSTRVLSAMSAPRAHARGRGG